MVSYLNSNTIHITSPHPTSPYPRHIAHPPPFLCTHIPDNTHHIPDQTHAVRDISNVRFFKTPSTDDAPQSPAETGGQGVHHGHTHGLSGNTHTKLTQLNAGSSSTSGGAAANGTAAGAATNSNSNSTDDNENNSFMQRQAVPEPIKPVAAAAAATKSKKKASHHGHGHGHSHGGGGNDRNMNMHGVYLHVLSDALGSVIVVISALVVWLTNWEYKNYLDPALSVLLVVLMLRSVWPLLRESAMILLQTVPTHIQVRDVHPAPFSNDN